MPFLQSRSLRPAILLLVTALLCFGAAPTTQPAANKYEKAIKNFETLDKKNLPPANPTLFVGSSSFTRWKSLESTFKEFHAINRGFGGSTFPDLIYFFNRVVLPYRPAKIVVYEGTNDAARHHTPEQIAADAKTFADLVEKNLPGTQVYFLPLIPAPIRASVADKMDQANALIQTFVKSDPHLHYIDARHLLTDAQGKADPQFYEKDRLHPNAQGYARWIPIIASALKAPEAAPVPAAK